MNNWPMSPPVLGAEVEPDFELPALPEDFVAPVYGAPEDAAPPVA